MKKIITLSLIAVLFFAGCKKDDDTSITNNGSSSIMMALCADYQLNITSSETLTYTSDNTSYVTVSGSGLVTGKNVGSANIIVSNGSKSLTIHVEVVLFIEPTLDFNSSVAKIKSLYGEPYKNHGDTILIYGANAFGYSTACWQMDFFFRQNGTYKESDVYIKNNYESLLNDYVEKNFYPYDTIVLQDTITAYMFLNAATQEDATVKMGKIYNANKYGDILLYYYPFVKDQKDNVDLLPIKKSKVSCDGIRL